MIPIHTIEKEFDAEIALIIVSIRGHFKTSDLNEVSTYIETHQINWENFIIYTEYHKVQTIVYPVILACGKKNPHIEHFKHTLQQITLRNWQLAKETERVIELFQSANIQAIPYKGTAYSQQFYGNLVSRYSSDIDLLIDLKDVKPCVDLLKKEGYIPEHDKEIIHGWNTELKKQENEYNMDFYQNDIRLFHVELHWSIGNPIIHFSDEVTLLMETKPEGQILIQENITNLTNVSHLLAMLFHHAGKDVFNLIRNLIDIAQASQKLNPEELEKFQTNIEKVGLLNSYDLVGKLIDQLLGIQIPNISSKNISSKTQAYFLKTLLDTSKCQKKPSQLFSVYQCLIKRILLLDDKSNMFNAIIRHINLLVKPSISDYHFFSLPKQLHFFYLIIRPFRVLKELIFKS